MIQPTFLARFTPSLMPPETLEAIFVQRQKLASRLVSLLCDSIKTAAKHHALLIGPRGIGKTHLVALIYHRLQAQEDLRPASLVAWLREEEWGVDSFLDLLLRILRALNETYPNAQLTERMEALYELSPDEAERVAAALLKEFADERTVVLLVENLDELFAGLGEKGQQRLRAYIQENPFLTILATAQALFNGVSLQTSPFYGFFRIHHLQELSFDEAIDLLESIAHQQEDRELAALIPSPLGRARIRVLRHLAGGNHRIHIIFSQFLTRETLDDLIEPFLGMLDDLTPYYQARIARLSAQQRKVVEYLCEVRGAAAVKQIAQRNFMTHQTASGQLKKLQDWGYVRSQAIGRESFYELREPLMRLCIEVKKSRGGPIGLFVDFLRLWYTPVELQQHLKLLAPGAVREREYVRYALQEPKRSLVDGMLRADREPEAEEEEGSPISLSLRAYEAHVEDGDFAHALDAAEEMVAVRGKAGDWFRKGVALAYLDRHEEALTAYDQALEIDPQYAAAWNNRGVALDNLDRHKEALIAYDQALELDPNNTVAWFNRAEALVKLDRWQEGLTQLEDGLTRFSHDHKQQYSENVKLILQHLFNHVNSTTWPSRIADLLSLYAQRDLLPDLGQSLVQSIPALFEPNANAQAAQSWFDTWQQAIGDRAELTVALRLLKTAVRFRQNNDPRALLDLPIEEREILEQVLSKTTAAD